MYLLIAGLLNELGCVELGAEEDWASVATEEDFEQILASLRVTERTWNITSSWQIELSMRHGHIELCMFIKQH